MLTDRDAFRRVSWRLGEFDGTFMEQKRDKSVGARVTLPSVSHAIKKQAEINSNVCTAAKSVHARVVIMETLRACAVLAA